MKTKSFYFTVRVDVSFDEKMSEQDAVVAVNEEIEIQADLSSYAKEEGLQVDGMEICGVEY